MSERKEPTVSSVLDSKEDLSDRRARSRQQRSDVPSRAVQPQRPVTEAKSSSGFVWFTFMVTVLALAGLGYALWQLNQAQAVMQSQSVRLAQLEDKLALSDDSATQSLSSIGAKVRELNVAAVKAESEIDKLWAARNVNVKAIKEGAKKVTSLGQSQAGLAKTQKKLSTTTSSLNKKVTGLSALKASVDSTSQSVSEHDLLLQSVRERISNHSSSLKTLSAKVDSSSSAAKKVGDIDKRLKSTEEAITSFDAFRRTVNRDLLQLKQPKK